MKSYNKIQEDVKKLIANGETNKALEKLLLYTSTHNQVLNEELLLLSSQNSKIERNSLLGLGENAEERNRLIKALIEINQSLGDNPNDKVSVKKKTAKNPISVFFSIIFISILVVILITSTASFFFNVGEREIEEQSKYFLGVQNSIISWITIVTFLFVFIVTFLIKSLKKIALILNSLAIVAIFFMPDTYKLPPEETTIGSAFPKFSIGDFMGIVLYQLYENKLEIIGILFMFLVIIIMIEIKKRRL